MKVLVTGANGFLGKFVSENLIEDGHTVIATDVHSVSLLPRNIQTADFRYYSIDLTQSFDQVIPLIDEVDSVVHLAAIVGIQNQIAPALTMYDLNVVAAGNIVRFCSKLNKYLIFASTSEIFGKNPNSPWSEITDCEFGNTSENRWAYGLGKALIEELIFGMAESDGLQASCIRFFNLYGPGQGNMYLIPSWINSAMNKIPIKIYGSGLQDFSFTYVEDAAMFIASLVKNRATGPFNFGSQEITSILHLSEVLKDFFPDLVVLSGLPNREGETSEYSRIPNSIRSDFHHDFIPLTSLRDGLVQTIAFYARNG